MSIFSKSVRKKEDDTLLFSKEAEKAISEIASSSEKLVAVTDHLQKATLLPFPVQTFPTTDNFIWENEKLKTANLAKQLFVSYENHFLEKLTSASEIVLKNTISFFEGIDSATHKEGEERVEILQQSLDKLLPCSPKKITAQFQKYALEAGWSYVSTYNSVIDRISELYPRCRAGIYQSRLKYSDVIQISEEILTTLRACSTLMEDLQRRYEILESLQNDLATDLSSKESDKIWSAIKDNISDTAAFGDKDKGISKWWKKFVAKRLGHISTAGSILAIPSLQIHGQMQRTQRVLIYFSTVEMFHEGWQEWRKVSKEIIEPNLKIMFKLKQDYFHNQIICICDLITYNGYSLEGLFNEINKMYTTE